MYTQGLRTTVWHTPCVHLRAPPRFPEPNLHEAMHSGVITFVDAVARTARLEE